ncbi:hypothetical protein GIB67_026332 [Kingdonia uniflora]|uniref:Uncharacterized protein n=1 Tax=Kingdonia uniflora TaxID=39325 RepID=A0A7J7N638_9MAGN|nr:hypothetical protein GIB67_026332 [Kingdonia uniflora]
MINGGELFWCTLCEKGPTIYKEGSAMKSCLGYIRKEDFDLGLRESQIESTYHVLAHSEIAMQMPFSRDYSHFVFDLFKDLWFMKKTQYEIDTYDTERDNILKLSLLRNIMEKCIQKFQRDITHKDLRNR